MAVQVPCFYQDQTYLQVQQGPGAETLDLVPSMFIFQYQKESNFSFSGTNGLSLQHLFTGFFQSSTSAYIARAKRLNMMLQLTPTFGFDKPIRLLVSARAYQSANSAFLSQQSSTSRAYQPRIQPVHCVSSYPCFAKSGDTKSNILQFLLIKHWSMLFKFWLGHVH